MPEPQYYFEKEGHPTGPVPAVGLVAQGVRRDTLVWTAGMNAWAAAGQVDALMRVFPAVPPPLPARTGPPPLPRPPTPPGTALPGGAPAAVAVSRPMVFAPAGYSLPLLGTFEDDRDIWALDDHAPFGAFAADVDLASLHERGFQTMKQYRFRLNDPQGQPLLVLFKPKAPLFNPLENGELQVFDGGNHLLGVCRRRVSLTVRALITVEDARGAPLLKLNPVAFGSRDLVLETAEGVIGRVRRTEAAHWTQVLVTTNTDRFEVIFEPGASDNLKALGISAVLAAKLFVKL